MSEHRRTSVGSGPGEPPLLSEFANDADMVDLVEYYVSELMERADAIAAALRDGDQHLLRRLAHQIKGSAGGYGFPTITDAAGEIERSILAQECQWSDLTEKVEALIALCRRARTGAARR